MMTDHDMEKVSAGQDLLLDFIHRTPALADLSAFNKVAALLNTGLTTCMRVGAVQHIPPDEMLAGFAALLETQLRAIREGAVNVLLPDGSSSPIDSPPASLQ